MFKKGNYEPTPFVNIDGKSPQQNISEWGRVFGLVVDTSWDDHISYWRA